MKVLFRVDASIRLGVGHYYRCLPLAQQLKRRGCEIYFASSATHGHLHAEISQAGFHLLPLVARQFDFTGGANDEVEDAMELQAILHRQNLHFEWIISDHVHLGRPWESILRAHARRIFVIDDLANRPHDCDALLDPGEFGDRLIRYRGLVPSGARLLLGASYVPLRPEVLATREHVSIRKGPLRKILVFYGDADFSNETGKTFAALTQFPEISATVLVGRQNGHMESYELAARQQKNIRVYRAGEEISRHMAEADIMLGSGGDSIWERCALGLPAVVTVVAGNQILISEEFEKRGIFRIAGLGAEVTADKLARWIRHFRDHPGLLGAYSRKAFEIVDGLGTERVVEFLFHPGSRNGSET